MEDVGSCSEIITKFLLGTCQLRRQINAELATGLFHCAAVAQQKPDDERAQYIPVITGSAVEFYIEPMLSCIGDADTMFYCNSHLAIPEGYPPPTNLPAEFSSRVSLIEIVESGFPGYVFLVLSYTLSESPDNEQYTVERCRRRYLSYGDALSAADIEMHGPAQVTKWSEKRPSYLFFGGVAGSVRSTDSVFSVRCLVWPPQAADWTKRHRKYGWPDSAVIDHATGEGCDVVRVAHSLCKHDEWMRKHQLRLSFSRAEIVLLNSWLPIQQLLYHMLRIFTKTEQLTDIYTDDLRVQILSNYNLKTLMLWASELKPRSWWTDDTNAVRSCVKLLRTLAVWLHDARCRHYFISGCNLFALVNHSNSTEVLASRLTTVTESSLAQWFVKRYILKCAQFCPDDISQSFYDTSTNAKLREAVSVIVDFRSRTRLLMAWSVFTMLANDITLGLQRTDDSLTVYLCLFWIRELQKFNHRLSSYFTAVTFLHVASKIIGQDWLQDELLDVLATTCVQSNNVSVRRFLNARYSSVLSLSQAVKMMKVAANMSRCTVQLIEIELSKAYLYRALKRCKDSLNDSIYCRANVYLAVLHYITGQYQTAMDHCALVTRSEGHTQCSSHVVQGEILSKIDEDIDNILGLVTLYQYIRTSAVNQQALNAKLLAHYLHIKCLVVTQMSPIDEMRRYEMCFRESQEMFLTDVLVLSSLRRSNCSATDQELSASLDQTQQSTSPELDTTQLVRLLQQAAVEHLTRFRQLEACDFGYVVSTVTTDFEAMYAYKCGDYERCLDLSRDNVCTLVDQHLMSRILVCPEFIQLMDDDLASVTALMLIANPSCRDAVGNNEISQLTLSLYLMAQCQIRLRHPVIFLALTFTSVQVARLNTHTKLITTDQLLHKLIEQKIRKYISENT